MELADFMKETGLTDAKLAEMVKRDRSNVTRWRRGATKPDFGALVELERISKGQVTAKDFARAEQAR